MSKTLTNEQVVFIRTSLFSISAFSEDSARSGASKQHRRNCADIIGRHVLNIQEIVNNLPDAEPAPEPIKKPRAPRKAKIKVDAPAPEPMLALEG